MAAPVVQLRIPEDMLAAVDGVCGENRSAWILGLIERELLDDGTAPAPAASPVRASSGLGPGEPSPGVACKGPACWQRNTTSYGLREIPSALPRRRASKAATYQRHPAAARLLSGAA